MPRGRVPEAGVARDNVFCVRMTDDEKAALDKARGQTPRATFIRDAVKDASRKK